MAGNKTVDTEKLGPVFPESTPSVSSRLKAFRRQFHTVRATAGDTVHLPCRLSPEASTAARELRWFRGTDCIEVFQVTVGSGCEGSGKLTLRDVKVTDSGQYRCEMLGEKKEEMSVIHLHVSEFKLVSRSEDVGKPSHVEPLKPTSKQQSSPDFGPHVFCGHDVTLPCYLSPETSAVAMEIRWFKGTDCIYLYLNGQVTEGRGYEGRVSMFTDELQRGNMSLSLRDVQRSDYGEYRCEVTHGGHRVKNDGVRIKEFKLFSLPENNHSLIPQPFAVHAGTGNDVLLPGFLSPKTCAVAMEIRWFKGTDCLYLYQNGQVTEGRGYEGRVSMLTDELENGNVSLKLTDYHSDGGEYRCEVTYGKHKMENNIHLHIEAPACFRRFNKGPKPVKTPKERKRRASDSSDHRPKEPEKPGRRWSNDMPLLDM
ncbi:butyrophilin-like protein 2 isoform X2 [Pygocentrus nattereri]|uniref:Ig-like domain-containing protein n=1 Tax=Pygocentrus nattereri TaxID=42514 RepID=A0AAR2JY39_PYGNA|nr:butyrophilin-like protein 2 isoform X2 [Pygocentrus nattereri]